MSARSTSPGIASGQPSAKLNARLKGGSDSLRAGSSHRLVRLLSFFLLLGLLMVATDQAIRFGIRRIKTSDIGAFNRVMSGKVNSQIVIAGSSRALVHYDPEIIQKTTGRTAFNIGRNGSHIDMQIAVVKAYLEHNTRPDLLVFNLDTHSLEPTRELYDPAQYLPFLGDENIYAAIRRITPDVWKWRYLPLYGYMVEDLRFTWLVGLKGVIGFYPAEDYVLGYNPRDLVWTGDFDRFKAGHAQGYNAEIEQGGLKALRGLASLCAEQKIRLLLVYSPEYNEAQQLVLNRSEVFARFREIAAEFSVPFLDYSDSPICANRDLFYNSQHLNYRGARAFSTDLAAKIATDFDKIAVPAPAPRALPLAGASVPAGQ